MDFLVRMDTTAVYQLPDRERKELIERERMRGRELHAGGFLRKAWSLPGQKANVGIWSARDADQLTEALQSLPIWPLITLEVTPLATHPLFAEMAREGMEMRCSLPIR
jgi:muconolactone D-isomerase